MSLQTTIANFVCLDKSVVFAPSVPQENYGTEDPRVVYRQKTGEYFLMYTAVQQLANGSLIVQLAEAVTKSPGNKSSWERIGALFPVRTR